MTDLPNAFTTRPGAIKLAHANAVARYRDPADEQWALESGDALADLTHFEVVAITGSDRHQLLTTLSSQIITGLQPQQSRELLLLDPNGHITNAVSVIDDGETTWAIADPGYGQALVDYLKKMRFASRVEAHCRPEYAVVGQLLARCANTDDPATIPTGRDLKRLLAQGAGTSPEEGAPALVGQWFDPWPGITEGGASYTPAGFQHPARSRQRLLTIVARSALETLLTAWEQAGGKLAGFDAWEALRVEDLRPRMGGEGDGRSLPAELDWLRTAVHLHKGCYCGQESVARIINLGKPPRRLVLLQLDGSQARFPQAGDPVCVGGKEVGNLTTVVRHADLGWMALALIRRSVRADLELDVNTADGPISARQEVIVDPLGKSNVSPSERPGAQLRRELRGPVISNAPTTSASR